MTDVKLKLELETANYDRVLIGYVKSEDDAHLIIEHLGNMYSQLVDENISLLSEENKTIEELTSCPILQEWEGCQAIVGTWEQDGKEIIF